MDIEAASKIVESVKQAFQSERRLGRRFHLDRIAIEPDDMLLLEGDVPMLSQKKLALLRAAEIGGTAGIVDRVHVIPVSTASDRHIRAELREMYARDANFRNIGLRENATGRATSLDFLSIAGSDGRVSGRIDIAVSDGIVILNGVVGSLVQKRLAGAMAWWITGVRDVVNGIAVTPPEEDGPDQLEEAVRTVLDRNPAIDGAQIKAGVRGRVVRLTGLVGSKISRQIAENDAWAVFGVDDVINQIAVEP